MLPDPSLLFPPSPKKLIRNTCYQVTLIDTVNHPSLMQMYINLWVIEDFSTCLTVLMSTLLLL